MKLRLPIVLLVVLISFVILCAFKITPRDRELVPYVPCNGEVNGPFALTVLYPGSTMAIYSCHHRIPNDHYDDEIILLYVWNDGDKRMELINAMLTSSFADILEQEAMSRD